MTTGTAERSALRQLTELYGVQRTYKTADERRVTASAESAWAVLAALGADVHNGDARVAVAREQERRATQLLEPVLVAWNGRLPPLPRRQGAQYHITLEDGNTIGDVASASDLPVGYHQLHMHSPDGDAESTILAAPMRCHAGIPERAWGVFAPLYAMREQRSQPVGDFTDLEKLLSWVSFLGGQVAATLPISAAFLTAPFDPSPYSPASRLYWNELFIDMERLLANTDCVPARNRARADEWRTAMRSAAAGMHVDYREAAQLKRHVLEALADWFYLQRRNLSPDFEEFIRLYPDAARYAQFRAVGERHAQGWTNWPDRLRAGQIELHDYDDAAAGYHLYAQFVAHQQLTQLAAHARTGGSALYLDMPLGVHADSYDVWSSPELFVTGAAAGAPPDPFFTQGQNWGFPPLNPATLRVQRYEYLRRVLRTQLRYAGMLRIDHVMSLHRLFFVPHGFPATDGVYVRYPVDELYAVLTIESQRHQSAIVGEDLGTVPAEVRQTMKRHGVKRIFVAQFEARPTDPPLTTIPAEAVAALNTHDMPPFAAYWNSLGSRQVHAMGLPQDAAAALRKLLLELAASPADVVLVNLEDLWLEDQPQNVPGTSQEKPNWRRRLAYSMNEVRSSNEVSNTLRAVSAARVAPRDGMDE